MASNDSDLQARVPRAVTLGRRLSHATLALVTVVAVGVASDTARAAAKTKAPTSMSLGLTDEGVLDLPPADRAAKLAVAKAAGASIFRLQLTWANVAAQKPPTLADAANPDWPGYDWSVPDDKIKAIAAAGLNPLPYIFSAPAWAEGPSRPAVSGTVPLGTWRPDTTWLKAFSTAAAKRYNGLHPDPNDAGHSLPAVSDWQAWNEPNLWLMINPQWVRVNNAWVAASPGIYRGIQNAIYTGIKAANPDTTVITAGTAPYGDLTQGTYRIPPVDFWRDVLCVSAAKKPKASKCPVIKFDAIAHHPYSIGTPTGHATNEGDAKDADTGRITSLLAPALKRGTIKPKGTKPMWITETGWDSYPDPDGVSLATQGLYLEGGLRVFHDVGITHVIWFDLVDEAPSAAYGYADTYQSGLMLLGATPQLDTAKPSLTAFRFPVTVNMTTGRKADVWGMAPAGGSTVQLQTQAVNAPDGTPWTTVKTLKAAANRAFTAKLVVPAGRQLRATTATDASLPWPLP